MKKTIISALMVATVAWMPAALAKEWHVQAGDKIMDTVRQASPGDLILVAPGEYKETVYIDKDNITLRGQRNGDQYAVMNGGFKLNDGIIASGHGSIIDGFWVKGYKGNAIMTQGANNFQIINNMVDGAFYGIFPQFGRNGLIKGNTIFNSEDAGIYAGMSDNLDIVENVAHSNVMGLEFENCRNAFMARNKVYNNSTGIALTLIPGLPVKDANNLVIRDNIIRNNNHENFAPSSSIAAQIPEGLGILIVGPDNVTIENNVIEDNHNAGIFTIDMLSFGLSADPKVDPYSDGIVVMKNQFRNNGTQMSGLLKSFVARTRKDGFELISAGKGKGSCFLPQDNFDSLGTRRWSECSPDMSKAGYETAMLAEPVESIAYTKEQKGRLTYLAVCTGCHAYDSVLHGPSVESIQALYKDDIGALISYIREPVRKRTGFPEMPPQDYLGQETLEGIADYILNSLGQ